MSTSNSQEYTTVNTKLDNWCTLPNDIGAFRIYDSGNEHVRIVCMGDLANQGSYPLLRIHSSCLASEVFGAVDCDCADQLREAMKMIATEGRGLIVHLHQEGRGQGLSHKIRAVRTMQCEGLDTVAAFDALGLEQDIRTYDPAVQLLHRLNVSRVRLISNNPRKIRYLEQHGVNVTMLNTNPTLRPENSEYLKTKNIKLGHQLPLETDDDSTSAIHFYHSDQPWGELSNFSKHAVFISGCIWSTVEHFYQAQKFVDAHYKEAIRCCATPMLAKNLAIETSREHQRRDWEMEKESMMLEGLRAKFSQHPDLARRLCSSGERRLVEHTRNDFYWGDGCDGTGKNRLGHLLMQVRAEILSSSQDIHGLN